MKTKFITIILAFMILLNGVSTAQVGGLLKKGLNKALNKQIENEIDSAKAKDDQENQARPGGLGTGLFGGKTDIRHNDEYSFTGRIYMQMETYDKKDVIKTDYYTYFNANTLNAGIETRIANPEKKESAIPAVFLFDNDNKCFMMLMEGEDSRTGIISTIPDDSTLSAQTRNQRQSDQRQATITKTGNTRMIAGYKCDEYKVTEPGKNEYSNIWMTKDVKIKADKRNWDKAGMPAYNYPGFEGMIMLAMEGYNKNNELEMKMETKEIDENFRHSISTVGYSLIRMNFMQAGKK